MRKIILAAVALLVLVAGVAGAQLTHGGPEMEMSRALAAGGRLGHPPGDRDDFI